MLDKNSKLPLYMQLKDALLYKIKSGELKKGCPIPTEHELCNEYGISRFPVRQAMEELVSEGYLTRMRGRGSFISEKLPESAAAGRKKLLGLVMGGLTKGLCGQILDGYEKQARKRGYMTIACCTEFIQDEELNYVEQLVELGISGMNILSCDDSRLPEIIPGIIEKGIYVGFLDRNPGMSDIDYIGSDNIGGAYTALSHLGMQGYRNVAFISYKSTVSSINERLKGYLKAVDDFGLNSITHIDMDEDLRRYPYPMHRFFLEKLKDELAELKSHTPLGIFAINDGVALKCMNIFQAEGLKIGKDVGIVGFDNSSECEYAPVPLTSVAQNGLLIGQSAADIAIDKIEGKSNSVYKSIVPTQLVIRSSCGERAF